MTALFGPAGGLGYHGRALRHRRRWAPFVSALAAWLGEWRPTTDALLLVGPSAGWCLPPVLLARFARLHVLEPDPLARLLLRRRFATLADRFRFHAGDYLEPDPARTRALAADFPGAAILFCNVLGQLPWLHPAAVETPAFSVWKADLGRALAGRPWASFHDRLSGPIAPRLDAAGETAATALDDQDLLRRFYARHTGARVELLDHGTAGLFPDHPRRFIPWEIGPGRFHLIEAVRDAPPLDAARASPLRTRS
jgi:hypothetical protein